MRDGKEYAILVELQKPYNGRSKWLFGSKRAIFRQLPPAIVGIAYSTLVCKHNLREPFSNNKCTITRLELVRTATNRAKQ